MTNDLTPFFAPRGVALIGASPNPDKLSYGVLRNLTQYGYRGGVYPVNPRHAEIGGLACYPNVAAVPDPVDLAVIVLPTPRIPATLQACGERGLKAATIISNGFKEAGSAGAAIEAECLAIARRYGLRVIGPNCVGTIDLITGLNTTFIEGMPQPGPIGFVSQSGGVCGAAIDYFYGQGVGFSKFVSLGNQADVSETDVIDFLADDPATRVIAVYVEGINNGRRFMEVARRVTRRKPVVLLKAGRTRAGEFAVSSHTGAMAGSLDAYRAALRQCGVIQASSMGELFDVALALAFQPPPAGERVFVLSNSGGPAALTADHLSELGVALPALSPQVEASLREGLDPAVQFGNPIDMLGGAGPDEYEFALPVLLSDPAFDTLLVILVPHLLLNPTETARRIGRVARHARKPLLTCFVGGDSVTEARQILHRQHIPMYALPESACRAAAALGRYGGWRNSPRPGNGRYAPAVDAEAVERLLAEAGSMGSLGEAATRPVLRAYGIPVVPGDVARTEAEAVALAGRLGYPAALKIVSPGVLHKTEADGIRLNLADGPAVAAAFRDLWQSVPGASGVLVESMAPAGPDVIVGMRRDPQFGPLLMVGLGGIYVELLTDVAFRVAPVEFAEALAMLNETKAGRLLAGWRGQSAADTGAVAAALVQLGRLALDFPQIQEIEINPLRVLPQGALALDGRIVLSPEGENSE